ERLKHFSATKLTCRAHGGDRFTTENAARPFTIWHDTLWSGSPRPRLAIHTQLRSRIVTLLTDFGFDDYFVGAMKGVILTRSPSVTIVDITHTIPPHDIFAAAFILSAAYSYFPAGSIHLAVVDPGVGSDRRPILVETPEYLFVG